MKITTSFQALGILAAALAAPLSMAQSAPLKIGVVTVQELVNESPQAKQLQTTLQTEFAPRLREIETQQKELKAREEKLQKESAVMSETERTKAEKELREGYRDLGRKQNEAQEDANLRRNEEYAKLQKVLIQEIQNFAKAQGYDMILGEGVLYSAPSMNVTASILSALQARSKAPAAK